MMVERVDPRQFAHAQLCVASRNAALLYHRMKRDSDAAPMARAAVISLGCPAKMFRIGRRAKEPSPSPLLVIELAREVFERSVIVSRRSGSGESLSPAETWTPVAACIVATNDFDTHCFLFISVIPLYALCVRNRRQKAIGRPMARRKRHGPADTLPLTGF